MNKLKPAKEVFEWRSPSGRSVVTVTYEYPPENVTNEPERQLFERVKAAVDEA